MIESLYSEQCQAPFPYISPLDFDDLDKHSICAYIIDLDLAGTISSYLYSIKENKPIKMETYHYMEQARNDLEFLLQIINDYAYDYFYDWYILSNLVLDKIKNNPEIVENDFLLSVGSDS